MRRKLIVGERIMYVDAETAVNCVFTVKIKGSFTLEILRNALYKIQQKHPLLRATVKEDTLGIPYFISSNAVDPIPVRIVERITASDWETESKKEWHKRFDSKGSPMARIVWLKDDEVSELMLVCPHCVCDGSTVTTLMSELLTLLDKPETSLPPYRSFDSIEGLISRSYSGQAGKLIKAKLVALVARLFFLFKSKGRVAIGESYMQHRRLDAGQSTALAAACKAEGVTVHAALCVSFLRAFQQVAAHEARGKVICPVDIRRFVPEIKADHMFAFAPIAELSLEPKRDFWDQARKIKKDLNLKIERMDVQDMLIMSEYFHASAKKMINFLQSAAGSHDVTLSNMGKLAISENFDSFELEAIYSPTVAFPWKNPNTLVTCTYKGEMDFCLSSNEAYLNNEKAMQIMDTAIHLLIKAPVAIYA